MIAVGNVDLGSLIASLNREVIPIIITIGVVTLTERRGAGGDMAQFLSNNGYG